MKKLGVCIRDLGTSQLNHYLINNINYWVENRHDTDIIAFYENLAKPCELPNFAIMPISDAYGYDGSIIATTVKTAVKLLTFPCPKKKFFYVWDLEWMRAKRKRFYDYQGVYGNHELQLVARTKEHADIISKAWNRKDIEVINNFNLEEFMGIL